MYSLCIMSTAGEEVYPEGEDLAFIPEEGDPVLYEEVGEWLHGCVLGTCVCWLEASVVWYCEYCYICIASYVCVCVGGQNGTKSPSWQGKVPAYTCKLFVLDMFASAGCLRAGCECSVRVQHVLAVCSRRSAFLLPPSAILPLGCYV